MNTPVEVKSPPPSVGDFTVEQLEAMLAAKKATQTYAADGSQQVANAAAVAAVAATAVAAAAAGVIE